MSDITIRPFSPAEDLDPVLRVLETSLPDIAKEPVFRWKHLDNPFGPSPGYLAYLEGELVGVRFFMRWQFRNADTVLDALRPVDTVTLPAARGRGVFKRLTLHGLADLVEGGRPIIFNTPNANSLPGYLKMGWQTLPRPVEYEYRLLNPFGSKAHQILPGSALPVHNYRTGVIETHKTPEFLRWRYPQSDYGFASLPDRPETLLVYSIKELSVFRLLNVVDYCGVRGAEASLIQATGRMTGCRIARTVREGAPGLSGPSIVRGRSVVAIRASDEVFRTSFLFSNGDLQSIL